MARRVTIILIFSFVIKDLISEAKAKDTKLFQGQLQGQAEIRIATTK